jgi:YVTN family beta-propeller protein
VKIRGLPHDPYEDGWAKVGSEPTGIAMTPSGKRVWVANWVDGTVTEVDTKSMKVKSTVDLNEALVGYEQLGDIEARPALAHPRSVAITSNRNNYDDDETVLITEYFGQRYEKLDPTGANADTSVRGVVYKLSLEDRSVKVIPLEPLADMGFRDHENGQAGCYPNQLQSITIADKYAFVSSICASPKGPSGVFTGPAAKACMADAECPGAVAGSCVANKCKTNCDADLQCGANGGKCVANVCAPNFASVKTQTATMVSVIDIQAGAEVTGAAASLHAQFDQLFGKLGTADDGSRRLPAIPAELAFIPRPLFKKGKEKIGERPAGFAYLAANGADAVFPVKYVLEGGMVKLDRVGDDKASFIDLNKAGLGAAGGKNPIGIAIGYNGRNFALVGNEISRNLTLVDLKDKVIAGGATPAVVSATAPPDKGSLAEKVLLGKRFAKTGTGRWSLKGQAWQSCESCHTDGLSDNVSWFFGRGLRQSIDLATMFASKNGKDQRILNWTAFREEMDDFENNTRGVSGGVGAIVKKLSDPAVASDRIDLAAVGHTELNGSAAQAADKTNPAGLAEPGLLDDWANITEWARTLRSPRAPSNLDSYKVAEGAKLFAEANCRGCHGGEKWTISTVFYTPNVKTMIDLSNKAWIPPVGFPTALLPATTAGNQKMRFPADKAAFDQLQCILRPVGTFGVEDGLAGIAELRQDMKTPSQGNETDGKGFNPPSLLGMQVGAPFLHSGGALTLESLFSDTFAPHHGALKEGFLSEDDPYRDQKVSWLVEYILSIDEGTTPQPIPAAGPQGGDFCSQ